MNACRAYFMMGVASVKKYVMPEDCETQKPLEDPLVKKSLKSMH